MRRQDRPALLESAVPFDPIGLPEMVRGPGGLPVDLTLTAGTVPGFRPFFSAERFLDGMLASRPA